MLENNKNNKTVNNNNSLEVEIEEQINSDSSSFNSLNNLNNDNLEFSYAFYFLHINLSTCYSISINGKFPLKKTKLNEFDIIFLNKTLNINSDIIKKVLYKFYNSTHSGNVTANFLKNLEHFSRKLYFYELSDYSFDFDAYIVELFQLQIKFYYFSEISSNYITNSKLKDSIFLYYSNYLINLGLLDQDDTLFKDNLLNFLIFSSFGYDNKNEVSDYFSYYKISSLEVILYIVFVENVSVFLPENEHTFFLYNFLKKANIFIKSKEAELLFQGKEPEFFSGFILYLDNFFKLDNFQKKKMKYISYFLNFHLTDSFDFSLNGEKDENCIHKYLDFYENIVYIIKEYKLSNFLKMYVYKYFINYEKKIKFCLLELFINVESSIVNNNPALMEFQNLIKSKEIRDFKGKNEFEDSITTYIFNSKLKSELLLLFTPLDLSFISLIWQKHFKLHNLFLLNKTKIKTNKHNYSRSCLRVDLLKNLEKTIYINYYYKINYSFNTDLIFLDFSNYILYDLNYIFNLFKLNEEFIIDWSSITYKDFLKDSHLVYFYNYCSGFLVVLNLNKNLLISCYNINKKTPTFSNNSNDFLFFLSKFENILLEINNNKYNYEILINLTIALFNLFDLFTKFINNYCNDFVNIPKLHSIYLKCKKKQIDSLNFKNITELNNHYKLLVRLLKKNQKILYKNVSSFLNLLFLKKNFVKLIKSNYNFQFVFFFDFRGRIYTYDSNYNWISNSQLRPFLKINQKTKYSFSDLNISDLVIKEFIIDFLINQGFIHLKFLKEADLSLLINYTYINMLSISMLLIKNKTKIEYLELFVKVYSEKKFDNLKLKIINKILILDENLNKLKTLKNFNYDIYNYFNTITLSLDSVSNGFTHILGLFKDIDRNLFIEYLTISNYYDNKTKYDLYDILKDKILKVIQESTLDVNSKFLKDLKKKIITYLKNHNYGVLDLELSSELIINSVFSVKDLLLTRKLLKKPLMTILYSSRFSTWAEDIEGNIFEEIYSENSNLLLSDMSLNKLLTILNETNEKRIIKLLSYIMTSIFSLNKNLIPNYNKLIIFSKQLKNTLLNRQYIKDIIFELDENTSFSLVYYKESNKQFKVNSFTNKDRISFNEPDYNSMDKLDMNKIINASLPNIIHSCDGYICLNVLDSLKNKNINCISIHDCFIFPWYSYYIVKETYNKAFFEFYNEFNLYEKLYIKTHDNKKERLFEDYCINNIENFKTMNSFWLEFKDNILKAEHNLSFE